MKISAKSYYGLKAMVYLAKKKNYCSVKEISSEEGIPFDFLEKIFSQLKKSLLLKVKRGAQGGYALSSPSKLITVGQVVGNFEGSLAIVDCIAQDKKIRLVCPKRKGCLTRNVWQKVQDNLTLTLDSITLESLIK